MNKNNCLNFLKGVACIGVIIGHCGFPEPYGKYISHLFHFAVSIFFMISGYFAYYEKDELIEKKLPPKMIHIFKLTVIAEMLYGIFEFLKMQILGNNMLFQMRIGEIIIKIYFGTFFNGTLWFLYALFWSYVCLYIIHKFDLYKLFYKISLFLLVFHIIARIYMKEAMLDFYDVRVFRSFLLYGLPFVMWGNYIHRNQRILCNRFSNKQCLFGLFFGLGLTAIEYLLTRQKLDFYIGTIIMSSSMFMYAIKNPQDKINSILCSIGDKLSLYIYVLHILAIEISAEIGNRLNIGFYDWIKPIVAILLSITLAYGCKFIFTLKSRKEVINYGKN